MKKDRIALASTVMLTALIGVSAGSTACAQTYRVCAGVSPSGVKSYVEVYEYDFVTEKPSFPGGESKLMEFVNANRHYPKEAYRKGIQGRVSCSFVVNADGRVSNIGVVRSVNVLLNEEAMRIISKMPAWVPGKLCGQAVPVRVILTIPFRK